jgi:hypothetical protein
MLKGFSRKSGQLEAVVVLVVVVFIVDDGLMGCRLVEFLGWRVVKR